MTAQTAAIQVLQQLKDITENLTDEQFSTPLQTLGNSSLAQHTRHTLEFFQCLSLGLSSGCIDYDNREHNKALENSRTLTIETIAKIQNNINEQVENKSLHLTVCYGTETLLNQTVETNYFRELIYNIEHAVHHMAILKIGLREVAPSIELPKDFGVASSTIRYQQTMAVSA